MLQTDCKLDQFLKWLARFHLHKAKLSLFRNQAKRFESWLNGLEAGWMVYKQPEWQENCTISCTVQKLAEQPMAQMPWKLVERFTEAYKQGSLASQTQPTPAQITLILYMIRGGVGWVWLVELTS